MSKKLFTDQEQKVNLTEAQQFQLIHTVIEKHNLKRMIRYLCQLVGVSRSGYYRYFSDEAVAKRQTDHQADETSKISF